MSSSTPLQVAIDGPAASGKTTAARLVARRLHALYLDTGAMYRAVAELALRFRTDPADGAALARLCEAHPVRAVLDEQSPMGFRIYAGERELDDDALHSLEVTSIVPTVAAQAELRAAMVAAQRDLAAEGSVVMAGRDIGTVVLPRAAVKIYLTASVAARVERRAGQLAEAGIEIDREKLRAEIEERDAFDRARAASPLLCAPDAHRIDSSRMDVAEVVDQILAFAHAAERAR